jgi:uncharacterized delta-60 repeat protein
VNSVRAQTLADAVDAPQFTWTTGGNASWAGQTAVTHDGTDAARSGSISDSQESWLQTTVNGPGLLSFWWKVSSEEDFDFLEFHVNGLLQSGEISGEVDWQQRTVQLGSGNQTLRWRYYKDDVFSSGQDRGWVDMVSFAPASGPPMIVAQPQNQSATEGANVIFEVVAAGAPPLFYQWFKDTTALNDATNSAYTLLNVRTNDAGSYLVVVSNALGSIASTPAVLSVYPTLLDGSFNPGIGGSGLFFPPGVMALAVQADRKILVGGSFTSLAGQPRNNLGRLNLDGSLDLAFNPGVSSDSESAVLALAVQPDGKILVGGNFPTIGGQSRTNLGRLNSDGTVDGAFNPGAVGPDLSAVYCLAVQSDGKILVGGEFTTLGGQSRTNLGRLNADGTLDTTFNPRPDGPVYSLVVQPDGKILVGGYFTRLVGQSRTNLGRLNAAGTLDTSFSAGAGTDDAPDSVVFTLALQADGKVLVGGLFAALGGQPRANLGRLNANGTADAAFNPGADDFVQSLAVQTDGQILVGGDFTELGGQPHHRIARLNGTGTPDAAFVPNADGADFPSVFCMAVQVDGLILLGGTFTELDGQPRMGLARLNNTAPATQSLNYAGTTLTWLRGGTGPEILLTAFDHSSNGVAWTSLGTGTRISGGWQRTSATVPAGRIIRARGFTAGGGGSPWFVESYLGAPVITQQPASRTNNFGTTAQFQISGGGVGPFAYQWFKNGAALVDQGNIAGSTSDTLTLGQVANSDEGNYTAVLSGSSGSVTSSVAALTVIDPLITQHPAGAVRSPGGTVTFNVTAIGTAPLNFQWYRDATAISGATNTSLTLLNLSGSDAGYYTVTVGNGGGSVTSQRALLTVNGVTADTLNPGSSHAVNALAVQADGKILVGGFFTSLGGVARSRIARLEADGTVDTTFDPGASGGGFFGPSVNSIVVQPDGKILVGGNFTTLAGQTRTRIGRLHTNGTLDTNFNPVITSFIDSFTLVETLALQADGKIIVGGVFDTLAGSERNMIGRITATGALDSFNPGPNYWANSEPFLCAAVQADGRIVLGGAFVVLGGQGRTNLGRVTATGALDATFNPNPNGQVSTVAAQPDGKILVGGSFTAIAGQNRSYLARLNTNGTLDLAFDPGANNEVFSAAVQADGRIIVGGSFTAIGGQTRNRIARLHADGTLDPTFNPGAGNTVRALAVQADGKILVGGNFGSLAGQSRGGIGRLNNNGSPTQTLSYAGSTITWQRSGSGPEVWRATFDHTADGLTWTSLGAGTRISNGWLRTGVSLPAGRTLRASGQVAGGNQNASGWFVESYLGKPIIITHPVSRTNGGTTTAIFRVAAVGSEPLMYQWQKDGTDLSSQGNVSGATSVLLTLTNVLKADEGPYRVVVSNSFGSVTSLVANLTVLNPLIVSQPTNAVRNAGENVTFNVSVVGTPPFSYQWYRDGAALPGAVNSSLLVQNLSASDAAAYTVVVNNLDGSVTSAPAMLTVNIVTLDNSFSPQADTSVLPLAVQPDGKVLIGGNFFRAGTEELVWRLNPSGTVLDAFADDSPGLYYSMSSLAVQPDGKILVSGGFPTLGGQTHSCLGRLHSNLTLDSTFNARAGQPSGITDLPEVYALAMQADGKILVGGYFSTLNGSSRNNIGRFNTNGTLDTFNPGANDDVNTLAVQADGKILVGGRFSILAGQTRVGIGRLNANGTLDTAFNPGVDRPVSTLAVQADGKILVGGYFTTLGGVARNYFGRLNTNGTVDATFNPGANDGVASIAVQADGKILVGGVFTSLGGQTRNYIARLNSDGTPDLVFHPQIEGGSVVQPAVYSLALQPDGKILVGGNFYRLAGQPRDFFGRLNNTGPASESLTYANSTVTWLRGGTATEVWRTTFERSTNGVSWTSLGTGTRIPGGWQLTGVSLPASGTVRARGHVAGGHQNASAWFVESLLDLTPVIRLSLTREGPAVILSWTGGTGTYQVQQSANLNDPNSWQNVGAPITTNSITLPISAGKQFLRVRSQ